MRGGTVENIFMRNITAGRVSGAAVDIDLYYEEGPSGKYPPEVRNVAVENLTCGHCKQALDLRGYPDAPIRNVRLERCTFEHTDQPNVVEHVQGLVMNHVRINGKTQG